MDRFAPETTGGRLPVQRYLSTKLLNRITFYELDAISIFQPNILNNLELDEEYMSEKNKGEPDRSKEVLQTQQFSFWTLLLDKSKSNIQKPYL
jgi:hypothetical protein